MEPYTFSEFTLERLYAAGWYENRCRDTDGYQSNLEDFGYPFHERAREFLSSFGDLQIYYPYAQSPSQTDWCLFDPIRAANHTFIENIQMDAEDIGSPLCVIGECEEGHMILSIAADGRVIMTDSSFLACVGLTDREAVEVLVNGSELHRYYRR